MRTHECDYFGYLITMWELMDFLPGTYFTATLAIPPLWPPTEPPKLLLSAGEQPGDRLEYFKL